MKTSPDPELHRQAEQQMVQHVERLLADERLRVDTTRPLPVVAMQRDVRKDDKAVDLKRLMSEMNLPDRELQNRMPVGQTLDVTLTRTKWWFLTEVVGRLKVVCVSPTRTLLKGESPQPLSTPDVHKVLGGLPPSLKGEPTTLIVVSTSGFTIEARELADRRAERTVILAEPNDAGGWRVTGPTPVKALADLLDPEAEADKRRRVREQIDAARVDLLSGGLAADRIAAKAQLAPQLVEAEFRAYAQQNAGLAAKRLDGRLVLYREGASPSVSSASPASSAAASGGSDMPLLDRMKSLFARKGENEKKISFLAERRAALSQQRDRAYEDLGTLEQQEADLRRQFKDAAGSITKKRVTSQLLQLRKDLERRQQLLGVLNQQINVVSTHLHNLELVQQGQGAKLPDADEMTADAVKAEEMLAELEVSNELAGTTGSLTTSGLSAEEQALYEELERESHDAEEQEAANEPPAPKQTLQQQQWSAPTSVPPVPQQQPPRRSEPEAG